MKELNDLGESLEASLASEKLQEQINELADVTIEQLSATGDSLPIVSFITKSLKSYNAIRDYFFMEKVITYLTEIASIPPELRFETANKISTDKKYGVKFGKKVLNIIDRLDDEIKALYLAKAYKYLVEGQIDLEFYLRLGTIINDMLTANIETLQEDSISLDGRPTNRNLERLGLATATVRIFDVKNPSKAINAEKYKLVYQPGYHFTDTGRVINNIFLGKPIFYKSKFKTVQDFNKNVSY